MELITYQFKLMYVSKRTPGLNRNAESLSTVQTWKNMSHFSGYTDGSET